MNYDYVLKLAIESGIVKIENGLMYWTDNDAIKSLTDFIKLYETKKGL